MARRNILQWFRDISIARKLYFTVGVMALLIAIELFTLWFAINTLSAVRAYVGGEGLWSKAQKDAIYSLRRYARTFDENDYHQFNKFIEVSLGDRIARLEMMKPEPDLEKARKGFIQGRNHPEDVDGMIKLFRRFHNVSYIHKAIQLWTEADTVIEKLMPIATRLHEEVRSNNRSEAIIAKILLELDPINQRLTVLEDQFSYTLGEGSRWLENIILLILFIVALTVEVSGLILAISISRGIHRGLSSIIQMAEATSRGDFSARAKIYSKDEIGLLAQAFNHMNEELEHRTKTQEEAERELERKIEYIRSNKARINSIMEVLLKYTEMNFSEKALVSRNGDELDAIAVGLNTLGEELQAKTQELIKKQMNLAEAQRLSGLGSWELEIPQGMYIWSDEMYRIYGFSATERMIPVAKVHEKIHKADLEHFVKTVNESVERNRPFSIYYRIIAEDGKLKTLHCRGKTLINEKGRVIRVVGTDQDVTDRINDEAHEKLAMAATKSTNSVIIADREGKIEWVNDGFTKLTGYTLEEVKGTHGEVLRRGALTGLSKETNFYNQVIETRKPVTYESKNYTRNNTEFWVITTLTPVLGSNGEVERIVAIDSDITLRKQMEQDLIHANRIAEHSLKKGSKALDELLKAKRDLEVSMKAKEQFLANMSHEIRTPMNAIVGFTDLLLGLPVTPEQKQYIEAIKTSGENLLVIINDILDISRIQSGKIQFEKIRFRLSQVLSTLIELLLPRSVEKKIQLLSTIDKNIPDQLLGDPTRLNQILMNLVGNAIKFTESGNVHIRTRLKTETNDAVILLFEVIDTGIGIPKEKQQCIFETFMQASNDTTRKYGGSGLGLAIVKQLAEAQGGNVGVESTLGQGSTFRVELPFLKDRNPNNDYKKEEDKDWSQKKIHGLKVLLVEDNKLNQVLAKKILSDWGWTVELAENGRIAVEMASKQLYDLILMDIQLPELDGYEATFMIRQQLSEPFRNVPIMAMTAHAMATEEEKCRKMGMDSYISKPFDQKVLYQRILQLMEAKGYTNQSHDTNRE